MLQKNTYICFKYSLVLNFPDYEKYKSFCPLFFTSCQEKEDLVPEKLIGVWEYATLDSNSQYESVVRYVIKPNGSFSFEWPYREPGSNMDLGYQLIWEGNFKVNDNQVTFTLRNTYNPSEFNQPPFGPKEEMNKTSIPSSQQTYRFALSEDGNELTLFDDDPMASDQVYIRVQN
ncbi:MAG: hypothetical protein EA341_18325 [Mongoliibacter sp.]|uniref:hypothetical protein n=1 Tax=Mongoliibacter sp. TaxID=2022438 RepID=UPI0012F3C2D0|nr:hypothetical protein [Mongoliibacter sp.]TVP43263.1 MAG: hypothetical protein EA341_18325 [Mongoliibacter sp.]